MSRVHFEPAGISKEHEGAVAVDMHDGGHAADVHVGFLQVACFLLLRRARNFQENHIYDLRFTVPCYLGDTVSVRDPNAHVKMSKVVANKGARRRRAQTRARVSEKTRHTVHVSLTAHKHGLWTETLALLKGGETATPFVVKLHANVLGAFVVVAAVTVRQARTRARRSSSTASTARASCPSRTRT